MRFQALIFNCWRDFCQESNAPATDGAPDANIPLVERICGASFARKNLIGVGYYPLYL
jgi:hypothetical protein